MLRAFIASHLSGEPHPIAQTKKPSFDSYKAPSSLSPFVLTCLLDLFGISYHLFVATDKVVGYADHGRPYRVIILFKGSGPSEYDFYKSFDSGSAARPWMYWVTFHKANLNFQI